MVVSKKSSTFALAFVKKHDSVAQQVEHIPFKDGVLGSSPSWITERSSDLFFLFYKQTRWWLAADPEDILPTDKQTQTSPDVPQ